MRRRGSEKQLIARLRAQSRREAIERAGRWNELYDALAKCGLILDWNPDTLRHRILNAHGELLTDSENICQRYEGFEEYEMSTEDVIEYTRSAAHTLTPKPEVTESQLSAARAEIAAMV